ncbi:MAG: hypothetical protein E2O38_01115 [Proteobacteria bacterium]|nr:MAG: hypothetical protein E2O38_01115 [Pseudomonadota bacterium]
MGLKRSTILKSILGATVLALGVIILGLVPINLSFVKDTIEQYVRENLDLEVTFQGPLRLRLGLNPRVEAAAIEIHKLGAVDEVLARVATLSVNPRLFEIFQGRMHMKAIQITGIQFDYCAALPTFGDDEIGTEPLPSIAANSLMVTNLHIFCGNRRDEHTLNVVVAALNGSAPANGAMSATVRGRVNDLPIELEAHSGNLNALLASPETFPLQLSIAAQGAQFRLEGAINEPLGQPELRADISLRVQNPQSLLSDLGISIPEVAAFEIAGQARLTFDAVGIENLVGKIGNSNIDARGLARFSSERNYYEVDAHLSRLQPDLFGSASVISEENDALEAADLRSLFDALREFDGKMHLTVDQLTSAAVQLDNLDLEASLSDGSLVLSRYQMLFMGSLIEVEARLDMQGECAEFRAHGRATDIDLKLLTELLDSKFAIAGNLGRTEFKAQSCGNTLTEHRNAVQVEVDVSGATISYENLDIPMQLDTLKVNAGWSQPSRAVFRGQLLDEKLSVDVQGGTIENLAAGSPWPITLEMAGPGVSTTLVGNAALGADSVFIDMHLGVDVPRIGALHRWIEVDPASELPLSVSASIQWGNDSVLIDGLDAALGHSDVKGRLEYFDEDTAPVLVTELRSAGLDIMELKSVLLPKEKLSRSLPQSDQVGDDIDNTEFLLGLDLPSVDLDLHIEQLYGTRFEIRDVALRGNVRNQLIDNANLSMRLDDFLFEGAFNIDLRNLPGKVSYQASATDLDIGRLLQKLDLMDDTRITVDQVNLDYASHGTTLREIAVNGETLAEFQNLNWVAGNQDEDTVVDVHLARLVMAAAPDQPTIWEATGVLDGISLKAWAETPPLGDILHGEKKSPLTVVASLGNVVAMLSGNIDYSNPDVFSGELVLSGEKMDPETVDFAQLESPLKGFELRADLMISDGEISVAKLSANIGTSHATGYAKVNVSEDGKEFEVRLQAPHVQTDDFVDLADAWRERRQENDEAASFAEPETRALGDVVREYIEALTLENSFNVRIGIDELFAGDHYMGGAQIHVLADKNNFRIKPMKVTLPGGDIDAEYVVQRTTDGVDALLNIYIERLEYGDLLRLLDPDVGQEVGGYIYLDTSLTSRAPTTAQLSNTVQGRIDLMIIPEDITAGVLDLWAANLVLAVLPTPKNLNKSKKLNCMVASFSADEGVMKSNSVLLDTTAVIVRGRGRIDIANRTLNMIVVPQAKREKFFSMSTPVAITGSWDDFRVGATRVGMVATLFRWYLALIYVPYKWLSGERFPADGLATCFNATKWDMPTESD